MIYKWNALPERYLVHQCFVCRLSLIDKLNQVLRHEIVLRWPCKEYITQASPVT